MNILANPTRVGIEKGYPERVSLPDELVSWELSIEHPQYHDAPVTNLSPQCGTVLEKLERAGLEWGAEDDLRDLALMSNGDAETLYGKEFADCLRKLRFPLGRTGINGVGIFYEAGESLTADMIVFCPDEQGLWLPLVTTRGRKNTPGGFAEATDKSALETALREFKEETSHDFTGEVRLTTEEIKLSDHITDHGWLAANVFAGISENRFEVKINPDIADDAEEVEWFAYSGLRTLVEQKQLSKDKFRYITDAAKQLGLA